MDEQRDRQTERHQVLSASQLKSTDNSQSCGLPVQHSERPVAGRSTASESAACTECIYVTHTHTQLPTSQCVTHDAAVCFTTSIETPTFSQPLSATGSQFTSSCQNAASRNQVTQHVAIPSRSCWRRLTLVLINRVLTLSTLA